MSKNFDQIIDRVKEIFEVKSDADVAKALNIEPGTFSYSRKKGNLPAVEILQALQNKDINIEWVFYGLGSKKILPRLKLDGDEESIGKITVRFFDDVRASAGMGCLNGDNCEYEVLYIDRFMLPNTNSKNIDAIRVKGDSMEPTISEDDLIFVDKNQCSIRNGKIFIIRMNDEVFVKKIFISPKGLIIKSDNEDYPSFEVSPKDIEVLGQVIYTMEYHG